MKLVAPIFNYMDSIVDTFVSGNLGHVINAVSPVVAVALSCTLITESVFMLVSPNAEPLSTLMQRFLRWGIIISIASAGGLYQSQLAHAALHIPDEFGNLFILSGNNQNTNDMGNVIDTALTQGWQDATKAFSKFSVWSGAMGSVVSIIEGVVIVVTTAMVCGMGAAYIIMAKMLMAIVLCLGPIAIYCLLFKATTGLFNKWVGTIIHYGLVSVFVSVIFGLLDRMFENNLLKAASDSSDTVLPMLASILMAVIAFIVMKQVPEMASRLSDGVQVAAPSIIDAVKSGMGMARGMQSRSAMKSQTASQKAIQQAVQQMAASAAGGPAAGVANAAAKAATRKAG